MKFLAKPRYRRGYRPQSGIETAVKRAVDLALATVAFVLVLPIFAITAIVVLVCDGRPVFFRQQRVGHRGRPFTMLKFRTMVGGAEQMLGQLQRHNERSGPLFKMARDPRVTKLGRFLRDASIDELPQLLNVLRGDMSLVGPRPALSTETAAFDPDFVHTRQSVRPGVTGLWQIGARHEGNFEEYERLDRMYIETRSLRLDLAILLLTVPAVIRDGWRRLGSRDALGAPIGAEPAYLSWNSTPWYTQRLTDYQAVPVGSTYMDGER
jgi:lipopolysaccharide/colanic/teichoic acid biosynthesis glycosyltransferase